MFISAHAMGQQLAVPTPTIVIYINGKRAIALLDSGCTTSIVNAHFAAKANCHMIPVKLRAIAVAGGGKLLSIAVIPNCEFQIAKLKLSHNFRTLELPAMMLSWDMTGLLLSAQFLLTFQSRLLVLHSKGRKL